MLTKIQLYHQNRGIDWLPHVHSEGDLLLDTPYQRGSVWGTERRRNLIRSILMGIPIGSLTINDRLNAEWGGQPVVRSDPDAWAYAVIDGKQRIEAILSFLCGDLPVPQTWFSPDELASRIGDGFVLFTQLGIASQRRFRNGSLSISLASVDSVEKEEEIFDLINFGGVPQGGSDLDEDPLMSVATGLRSLARQVLKNAADVAQPFLKQSAEYNRLVISPPAWYFEPVESGRRKADIDILQPLYEIYEKYSDLLHIAGVEVEVTADRVRFIEEL